MRWYFSDWEILGNAFKKNLDESWRIFENYSIENLWLALFHILNLMRYSDCWFFLSMVVSYWFVIYNPIGYGPEIISGNPQRFVSIRNEQLTSFEISDSILFVGLWSLWSLCCVDYYWSNIYGDVSFLSSFPLLLLLLLFHRWYAHKTSSDRSGSTNLWVNFGPAALDPFRSQCFHAIEAIQLRDGWWTGLGERSICDDSLEYIPLITIRKGKREMLPFSPVLTPSPPLPAPLASSPFLLSVSAALLCHWLRPLGVWCDLKEDGWTLAT